MKTVTLGSLTMTALWMASACGSVAFEADPSGNGSGGMGVGSGGAGGLAVGTTAPSGGAVEPGGGAGGDGGMGGTASGGASGSGGTAPTCTLVTSAQGEYWTLGQCAEVSSASADVTVDDTATAQTWEGFGGAFNELGWSYLASKQMQDQAMQLLFGTDGCRLAWGRIPMGASDYAISRYTDDDTGTDVTPSSDQSNRPPADPSLSNFSIDRDGQRLIPYVKAAQAVRPDLRFWASPWTPPVWMTTGYKKDDGNNGTAKRPSYYDGGSMRSDDATLTAHAQYFVKFVQAYQAQGIAIEVVAPQNEPNYDQNYPSCLWDKATYTTFIGKYLGPALSSASPATKLMLGTLSNSSAGKDADLASAVLADPAAKAYCSVVGVQWGMLDANKVTAMKAGLPVWATEHKCGNYPWNPAGYPKYVDTAPNDQAYAVESWGYIRDAIKKVGVTSYNAWNMVLDKIGKGIDTSRAWAQNALLVADSGKVTPTPAYYVIRHLSQFAQPGAKVVGTRGGDALAFKNPDGSLVAVMFNSGSAKAAYTVSIGDKKVQFGMPAGGWTTVVTR
jgi:glucosylceramidase